MRKAPKNSGNELVNMAKALEIDVLPVCDLDGREVELFMNIVNSRERDTITEHDRTIATHLAKTLFHLENIEADLRASGYTVETKSGTRANPLLQAMMQMTGVVQGLSRTLGISASHSGMAAPSQKGRNSAANKLRKALDAAADVTAGADLL